MSTILIDDRDGSNELIPLVPDCTSCRLNSGDVAIPGWGPDGEVLIGVEVKKLDDFLTSVTTGRLAETQLPPMFADYYQSWLLTIGTYREGREGRLEVRGRFQWRPYSMGNRQVPVGFLEASIIELQAIGLHHHHVATNQEAAQWIQRLARWWSKEWSQHRGLKKFDRTSQARQALLPDHDPVEAQIAQVVKEFPALGWERAWAAAKQFDSVLDAVNATRDRWAQVPGIGKILANTTYEAIRRRKNG